MRLIFMGTPDFAVPSLQSLINGGYKPIAVVTGEDKERGRGRNVTPTAVKKVAVHHDIPVIQPASVKDPAFAEHVESLHADVIVVVAFKILPASVFTACRLGAFNLHASLLPRFRGAAPIQRALMDGVKETGVTTFFLKEKVDTGNVILQERIPVGPNETAGELHDRLAVLGAEVVYNTVQLIEQGRADTTPQDDTEATPAPKIKKDDCRISWHASSIEVHNQIRALSPYPSAFTEHRGVRIKVFRSQPLDKTFPADAGVVVEAGDRIVVACATGAVEVTEIQREGRARVNARDFLNGYEMSVGDRLS